MNFEQLQNAWISNVECSKRDALQFIVATDDKDLALLQEVVEATGIGTAVYGPIIADMNELYNLD